ncbi:MAG: tyrosine-type recombinase/integrase, partial [Erysipelotrichaceae bacterium]|nr:tyrosine-type recombinase/integrase [Erysipelotrichaceae bacterium]
MSKKEEFQYYVTKFLTSYMSSQRNLSSNTIASYADAFRLLLIYFENKVGISANKVKLEHLTRDNIIHFLDWLEEERDVSAASRNIRLAAIHSFIKYIQIENPANLYEYQKILAIKNKKHQSTEIPYLSIKQIRAVLAAPDSSIQQSFRDKVLLTVLYDSGARVDELIHMKVSDIRLSSPASVTITGKGNKVRTVPLMGNTVNLLKKYIDENKLHEKQYSNREYLFFNRSGNQLTRAGIAYIINKYVSIANADGANITINVHPHVFRHSKAVHLLESGVELIYIRDILGHSSVTTTEIYARVCTANKRAALEKTYEEVTENNTDDWTENKDLMDWLLKLSREA